jgi:hypothetical protein
MEKTCTVCGETKLLKEYHKNKRGKYGRLARCKLCKKAYDKKYNQTEKKKASIKKYYQSEARKSYQKAYMKAYNQSEAGKAKKKAYMKAYSQTEAGKAAQKKYNQTEAGKAKKKAYMKAYRQSEAGKAYRKAYQKAYRESEAGKAKIKAADKNRYHNDPVFKLHKNLSSGFGKWIKGNRKTCRTEQYVGCTYNELLDHLESQFEEGMSWENHGEWQIDHFKARSRFDPAIEEEKFKCWHYTNLQPMWAEINNSWKDKKKPGDEFVIWMGREIGWVINPGIEKI